MKREEFVKVAEEALDSLPEEFRNRIQNVAILVEDLPPNQSRAQPGQHGFVRGHVGSLGPTRPKMLRLKLVVTRSDSFSANRSASARVLLVPKTGALELYPEHGGKVQPHVRRIRECATSREI